MQTITEAQPAYHTGVTIEPIHGGPGYTACITGHLADPESDPTGAGKTREAAALDLAQQLFEDVHPCACLAIAAVLREDMAKCLALPSADDGDRAAMRFAYNRAIRTIKGVL